MALTAPAAASPTGEHLSRLLAEIDQLAPLLEAGTAPVRGLVATESLARASTATLVLDGADPDRLPSLVEARRQVAELTAPHQLDIPPHGGGPTPSAGWLDTLRLRSDGQRDDEVQRNLAALEMVGAAAGLSSADLDARLLDEPLATLAELHARTVAGLVSDADLGRPRTGDHAVHDASTGRIVFLPVPASQVLDELERLAGWLSGEAAGLHPVVAAGLLQAELLRIHPYGSANGRVARAAARLLLRAGGLDPDATSCPEVVLAHEPMGYHEELASTLRRRDPEIWLERWGEAVAEALRDAARRLGALVPDAGSSASAFLAGRTPGTAFTVEEHRAHFDGDVELAQADLRGLLDAGLVGRVAGSRGLRFVVRGG